MLAAQTNRESTIPDRAIGDRIRIPFTGIKPFREWRQSTIDVASWDGALTRLRTSSIFAVDLLRRMRIIIRNAAESLEGNIQNRMALQPDIESALWVSALGERGAEARPSLESQLLVCDFVIKAARRKQFRITEKWLCDLHRRACGLQQSFNVATSLGLRKDPIRRGEYKTLPNEAPRHLREATDYAPVETTRIAMNAFFAELNSPEFHAAHPILQSSYALSTLLQIHPFADGNGRVARALALLFIYRANSVPFLALAQQRNGYVAALIHAASGDHQALVDFVSDRAIDAMDLMSKRITSLCADLVGEKGSRRG